MELRHLRYFKAVAERLSFTAAARHLGIAQPPLSTQIRNLEREIGTPLFVRSRREVQLTPAGRALLTAANDILTRADAAVLEIQDEAAGRAGTLRLAAHPTALSERISRRIRKFIRKHRGVRLQLVDFRDPVAGADVSLRDYASTACPANAISLEVSSVQLLINAKHRLAERSDIFFSDLVGECLIPHPSKRSAAEDIGLHALEQAGVPANLRPEPVSDPFWAVSVGLGLAFAASHEVIAWDVLRKPLPELTETLVLAAIPHPGAISLALPAFLEALKPD